MIEKKEIEDKAAELGVHTSNVQRDYVFGWILLGIYHVSPILKEKLILKGGNSFRKAYFEHARYSNDLDFSTLTEVDPDQLRDELNRVCEYVGEKTGVKFDTDESKVGLKRGSDEDRKVYEAKVYFEGFYGEQECTIRVKMDVQEFDRIFLPIQTRNIIHSYSDAAECSGEVQCHKLEELLASKLNALLHRRHSPDLYDFIYSVFFQKVLDINRLEVVSTFLKKTIYEPDPRVAKNILLELPFQTFRSIWNEYLVCPTQSLISFDDAEQQFREIVPQLFGLLSPAYAVAGGGMGHNFNYFSAPHRNTIMEAGQAKRMLRMMYDGLERLVEPYSLTFKVKGDGEGKEYFYGVDIKGGRSGKVGIKMYTEDKVQLLEMTEDGFEPRYEIELSKAGEHFGKTYFSKPFSKTPRPYTPRAPKVSKPRKMRSSFGSYGMTYTVVCSVCSKRFKRSSYDTKLNKHKDRFGNQCYGTYGYIA